MDVRNIPVDPEQVASNKEIQRVLLEWLSGKTSVLIQTPTDQQTKE